MTILSILFFVGLMLIVGFIDLFGLGLTPGKVKLLYNTDTAVVGNNQEDSISLDLDKPEINQEFTEQDLNMNKSKVYNPGSNSTSTNYGVGSKITHEDEMKILSEDLLKDIYAENK